MNENLAFVYGVAVGIMCGAIIAFAITAYAIWHSADRNVQQSMEDGQ